jgi:hypothetical protein
MALFSITTLKFQDIQFPSAPQRTLRATKTYSIHRVQPRPPQTQRTTEFHSIQRPHFFP